MPNRWHLKGKHISAGKEIKEGSWTTFSQVTQLFWRKCSKCSHEEEKMMKKKTLRYLGWGVSTALVSASVAHSQELNETGERCWEKIRREEELERGSFTNKRSTQCFSYLALVRLWIYRLLEAQGPEQKEAPQHTSSICACVCVAFLYVCKAQVCYATYEWHCHRCQRKHWLTRTVSVGHFVEGVDLVQDIRVQTQTRSLIPHPPTEHPHVHKDQHMPIFTLSPADDIH